jgi:hypothetical protein
MLGIGIGFRITILNQEADTGGGPPPETFHVYDDIGGQVPGDSITDDQGSGGTPGNPITPDL